jgi:Ser/Thr protein kinase RdoA (MazF antagonist)
LGRDVEIGWTHGDYHLGNVLIDDRGDHVIGVVDWGRAEPDGMTVLDKITLIVFEGATSARQDVGAFMLELLRIVQFAPADAADSDVLRELRRILPPDSVADLRSLLMLTWLKHVANNLKNEERTRAHGLWNLRTVDLVLHGAATIIGY